LTSTAGSQPAPAELAKAVGADAHLREWVLFVSVEAGRHQEQVGAELLDRRRDSLVERQEVLVVPGAGAQRNVHGRVALLGRPAGAGVERPLMQ
jgi:hypothetical protein